MYTMPHRRYAPGHVLGALRLAALPVALVLSLAAIPTSPAGAAGGPAQAGLAVNIPPAQLELLAGALPTGDLGLSGTGLQEMLSSLPAFQNLSSGQTELLGTVLGALPAATPVSVALENVLAALGVHMTPAELLGAVVEAAHDPTEVAKIIGDLAGSLSPQQLAALQGIFGELVGNLSGEGLAGLQGTLAGLLGGLGTAKLTPVLQTLEGALGGSQLTQLQALLGSLGSLSAPELQAQLDELLSQLSPTQLGTLLGELFGDLNPAQLQGVLGELLGELGFTVGTAGEVAEGLGMSSEDLASQIGVEGKDLPSDTKALTAPLEKEGAVMGLMNDLDGLSLGVLGKGPGEPGSGSGAGNGSGGSSSGGAGGNGGSPGGGSSNPLAGAGSTVVNLGFAPTTATAQPVAAKSTSAVKPKAKVKILSHRVRGTVATLVVQVPAAGGLSVKGRDARSVSRQVSGSERVTLRVPLTHAAVTALHRGHRRMKAKLNVAFKAAAGGASSSASTTVTFP